MEYNGKQFFIDVFGEPCFDVLDVSEDGNIIPKRFPLANTLLYEGEPCEHNTSVQVEDFGNGVRLSRCEWGCGGLLLYISDGLTTKVYNASVLDVANGGEVSR